MKRILAKIFTLILIIAWIFLFTNNVFATDALVGGFDGTNKGSVDTGSGENLVKKTVFPVLSVVRIVATGIAIIMITYLGIKYMSAAPDEKANIKNQLIAFTIGAVVVVGATKLIDIVQGFAKSAITTS